MQHQVTAKVVAVSLAGAVDGCHHHEDGQQDCRLGGCCRDKCREHYVDNDKAQNDAIGALAKFYHKPQGKSLCHLSLDKHTCQDKRQDIEPHHRVAQLRIGLLVARDPREHNHHDDHQRGEVVRDCLSNPQDNGGNKYCKHSIVDAQEAVVSVGSELLFLGIGEIALGLLAAIVNLHCEFLLALLVHVVITLHGALGELGGVFAGVYPVDKRDIGKEIYHHKGQYRQWPAYAL